MITLNGFIVEGQLLFIKKIKIRVIFTYLFCIIRAPYVTNAYYFCFALNVFAINEGARLDTRRGRCVVYFNR